MTNLDENDVIQINVGGSRYSTTIMTLLSRESNSFFAQFFAPDGHEQFKNVAKRFDDGTYFIDRDGELFVYILDYFRNGKLLLPDNFKEMARLREEIQFYQLECLMNQLMFYFNYKYPSKSPFLKNSDSEINTNNGNSLNMLQSETLLNSSRPTFFSSTVVPGNSSGPINPLFDTGGFITLGYRGTFAFGRDGQADVKFRKLHRILVCGKATLCREVFKDTLNESRDPDREGAERYTSRLYLKHQCLERACDNLAEKGFRLVVACSSGANGLISTTQNQNNVQDFINQRNNGDLEEQRWAHYTEYVFYREPQIFLLGSSPVLSPRN